MSKFKCPYCGALSDTDGFCKECDVGRVVPYFEESSLNNGQLSPELSAENLKPKCETAKLVIGILSMVLFIIIGFQSCAVSVGDALTSSANSGGAFGLIVAVNLLATGIIAVVARKTVKKAPWIINAGLLWANYFYAKMFRGDYKDLLIWGFLSFVLGVFYLMTAMRTKKQYIISILVSVIYLLIALI